VVLVLAARNMSVRHAYQEHSNVETGMRGAPHLRCFWFLTEFCRPFVPPESRLYVQKSTPVLTSFASESALPVGGVLFFCGHTSMTGLLALFLAALGTQMCLHSQEADASHHSSEDATCGTIRQPPTHRCKRNLHTEDKHLACCAALQRIQTCGKSGRGTDESAHVGHVAPRVLTQVVAVAQPEDAARAAAPHLLDDRRNLAALADAGAVAKEEAAAAAVLEALAEEALQRVRDRLELCVGDQALVGLGLHAQSA
jgi:hypothetical protein